VAQFIDYIIRIMYSTVRALGFLTRIPLGTKWFESKKKLGADADAFPVAGFIIGFIGALVLFATHVLGFSPFAVACFTVMALVILTGALHEDGLSDVADAFWSAGSAKERLTLMKDSRIGVFGALALIFSIGLRVILLADIISNFGIGAAFAAVIAIEAASRGAMVWMWYALPLAKKDGAAATAGKPDENAGFFSSIISIVILAILIIPCRGFVSFLIATGFIVLCTYAFIRLCRNKIEGSTGDTLGAMQQIATIALLAGLAVRL